MVGPFEQVFRLLTTLRRIESTSADRADAFERLIELPNGPWGSASLVLWADACAFSIAREIMRGYKSSGDAIDYPKASAAVLQAIADGKGPDDPEAIVSWLRKSIRYKILDLVKSHRRKYPKESGADALKNVPSPPSRGDRDEDEENDPSWRISEREVRRRALYDRIISVIQGMPKRLRVVAQMHYLEHDSLPEIRDSLGIEKEAFRKRVYRMKQIFKDDPVLGPLFDDETLDNEEDGKN